MLDRADGLLYVTTELDKRIVVIDPHTYKAVGAIPTGQEQSHMLAISPDGKRGYTANVGPGTVSVLDIPNRRLVKIIPLAKTVQRIAISRGRQMGLHCRSRPAPDRRDRHRHKQPEDLGRYPGRCLWHSRHAEWQMAAGHAAEDFNCRRDGSRHDEGDKGLAAPKTPQEIVVQPDGRRAYISCSSSGKVAVLNLDTWQMELPIQAGKGVDGMVWVGHRRRPRIEIQ